LANNAVIEEIDRMKAFLAGLAIVAAGLMVAPPAADASLVFDLTSNHCTVPDDCGPPNTIFGTVTLTDNGTGVDFDVHLNSPYAFAKTGSVDFLAFKFNATDIVLGDITVTPNGYPKPLTAVGPGTFNGDGTGDFAWGISCPTCGGGLSDGFSQDILFTVAHSEIGDFTTPNNLGNVFVADVGNTTNGATGPIDASGGGVGGSTIPEPATLLLLGSGLLGVGLAGRVRGLLQK
jgi:PEP-CTERM motif-containing protein